MTSLTLRSLKEIRADPLNRELVKRYPLLPFFEACIILCVVFQALGVHL